MKHRLATISPTWASFPLVVLIAALPGCGSGSDVDMGAAGQGGSGAGGTPGSGGVPTGTGGALGGSGGGGSGTGGDTCGGKQCSDHTGSKDFTTGDAPGDSSDTFGKATPHDSGSDSAREPAIIYPNHETMFPINVSRIRHDWTAGGGNTLFRLRFEGPRTTVNVYTTELSWTPDEEQWDWIAESNRGEAVTLTVAGLDANAPGDLWQSKSITLEFSEAEVEGAIYYWSTGTEGVMRALVSDPIPIKFYTDPAAADSGTCVACHTLSRDGKRLAVGYDGENLREASVPERTTILPVGGSGGGTPPMPCDKGMPGCDKGTTDKGMPSAWTTFSPDGEMLLVAANGILTLIDSDLGTPIGDNSGIVPIPSGTIATHPDWSALGDKVAITLGTKGGNKEVEGGSIALLPYNDGAWGDPEIIVASTGDTDNNFFPVFSPDSRYIAYVNAPGVSKDATGATLRLVPAGGGNPIIMTRLNERVNNEDEIIGVGNSMPTWAPSTKQGTFWLAFSSLRAYSVVRPQDPKEDQIWIAAVDPDAADPGFSAFWAPFQSVDDGNHRAFWTHSDADTQCGCEDVCDDNIDNDCDGTADGPKCVVCQPMEICGDGIDNDCDCVVDDCHDEICDDGIDNDGDGLIDSADPACTPH